MITGLKSGELIDSPYFAFMQQAVAMLRANDQHVLELEPEFFDKFACSSCGLCCQRPWGINLSREYFEQWQPRIDSHPQYKGALIVRENASEQNYSDIRRKPGTAECTFLMDDRRCFIQATYGEDALSECCKSFPRYDGWFGAFLGRFMITSCPEVHALNSQFPGIRYTIGKVVSQKWLEMKQLPHPLGLYQGYLWLGLQLDLMRHPGLSPIQALRRLIRVLGHLSGPHDDRELNELYVMAMEPLSEAESAAGSDLQPAFKQMLTLLGSHPTARTYLGEVAEGWRKPPELNADERLLLESFLRSYLAYRCLSANHSSGEIVDFFYPFYAALSLQVNVLQWLALAYREREGGLLTREHLLRAATAIGYSYEQSPVLIAPLRRLTPLQCLHLMEQMLVFDWTGL